MATIGGLNIVGWDFWIGTAIGLVGLAFSWWTYERTKATKELAYAHKRRALLRPEAYEGRTDRTFSLNGKDISCLNREYILLVSNGASSIRFAEHMKHATLK